MSELDTYREKARAFLTSMAPKYAREARVGNTVEQDLALGRAYMAARYDAGFGGINWPVEMGGQGLTHLHKITFDAEEMQFGMPNVFFGISLGMPVPIIMHYCEDKAWVKERVIKALRGEEIWCQLFSEPAGGSDLAGLRTRAEPDGNGWKMNGQKIWTSWAQYCDYGVIVTRSDPAVVYTMKGSIKAPHVIVACNGYLHDLEPDMAGHIGNPAGEELAHLVIDAGVIRRRRHVDEVAGHPPVQGRVLLRPSASRPQQQKVSLCPTAR